MSRISKSRLLATSAIVGLSIGQMIAPAGAQESFGIHNDQPELLDRPKHRHNGDRHTHSGDGITLTRLLREYAEQESSQQTAVRERRDLQCEHYHGRALLRELEEYGTANQDHTPQQCEPLAHDHEVVLILTAFGKRRVNIVRSRAGQ